LTARDAPRAWIYTVSAVLVFPWVLFAFASLLMAVFIMSGSLSIGLGVLIGTWFACGYLTDLALVGWVTGRFHDHFRFAATLGQEIDTSSYGEHTADLRPVASSLGQ
jgi:hypothetical protein